ATNGSAGSNGHGGTMLHAQAPTRWPMQDLWVQLTLPMPLWKRALDVLISSILLILLLPLFAVLAVLPPDPRRPRRPALPLLQVPLDDRRRGRAAVPARGAERAGRADLQ